MEGFGLLAISAQQKQRQVAGCNQSTNPRHGFGELILAYMGLLKSLEISCEPVLIGSKGYGRSSIVPYPFLNQFDEILLLATPDGKPQFLDLSDPLAPFG